MKVKCIHKSHGGDLIVGKEYEVLESHYLGKTRRVNWYRLVDESGEDFWYPELLFQQVK